jgi:type IV secretion system protein VirD4
MWRCLSLALTLCLCAAAQTPSASPPLPGNAPAFLKQMPEPERVTADIRGSDDLDTAARQVAALNRLVDVVITLSGTADAPGGPRLTAEEQHLNGRYSGAASSLTAAVYQKIDPDNKQQSDQGSKRNKWNRLRNQYYNDDAFISSLLQRYLTADLQEKYLGHMRQTRQHIQALNQKTQAAQRSQSNAPAQDTTASGSASFLGTVVGWGVIIAIPVWGIWWWAGRKKRRERKSLKLYKASNAMAMEKLGSTREEREATIDSMFDKRDRTLSVYIRDLKIDPCEYLRPISGMSPKEREALRTAYHLYNSGMLSDWSFYFDRMGIICGDGKALRTAVSKGDIDLRKYPRSVETAVNSIVGELTNCVRKYPDHPALRKLSARLFGDGGDLVPGAPLKSGAKNEPPVDGSLILGLDERADGTWWYYDGEGSLITIAPPGSGKTQSQVFPNLLMWKGAAVVLDVKGEIYQQTSKWRRENVGPVYKFSPLDPATSHGYNPLAEVRADPDYLWEDARFLADMMIVPSGAKDPFWENRARDVLTAAIARVCLEEDVAKRSMGDVLDVLHGVGWDEFVAYLEARIDFPSMTRAGHSLASMEPKTRDGVLQSALSSMSAWDGERIARATRKSDWSPLDLRGGKNPTIYICLKPNEVDSYISVLRVFIAQHIRSLTSTKVPEYGVHPILFILDELPRLRHMPPIEEALEIGRQYGLKLWLFAQSLGQLKEAYHNADGMIGGCAIRMFMNPSLHDRTAQKISDDIGFQESVIDGTRVKIIEPNVLAGPDYKDLVIVMAANARAARLRKYFAYADDGLKARLGSV